MNQKLVFIFISTILLGGCLKQEIKESKVIESKITDNKILENHNRNIQMNKSKDFISFYNGSDFIAVYPYEKSDNIDDYKGKNTIISYDKIRNQYNDPIFRVELIDNILVLQSGTSTSPHTILIFNLGTKENIVGNEFRFIPDIYQFNNSNRLILKPIGKTYQKLKK